ncbi:glycosyltransferase family 39 protein [Candidatus Nitrosopelagicus sp.]|nr:glycosyltransferase family 39 protein [Candidatus Nitrosopelagicus sp.]
MSKLEKTVSVTNRRTILGLISIITVGLSIRIFYFPNEIPIVTDGYFNFVYAMKTLVDGSLPVGYIVTNSGWSNFLSFLFMFSDRTEPLHLMNIQRVSTIIISSLTVIPTFYLLKKFVDTKWALFGSFMIIVEPRLLLISLEGLNYTLFFFIFISSIVLFLKKTNLGFFLSFICIALLALVRYEGILLIIPFSILYFIEYRDRRSLYKFFGMLGILILILVPVGILRGEATQEYCIDYIFGTVCGQDGVINNFLAGPKFVYTHIIMNEQLSETVTSKMGDSEGEFHREKYGEGGLNLGNALEESFSRLLKFIGISMIPFFGFFILLNFLTRIKNFDRKINFDMKVILVSSGIMLLPALYAYTRGIDEIRYVLVLLPLFCIFSILWSKRIHEKISKNHIMFILLILIIFSSIFFIEMNKRDYVHDMKSFVVSKEIVKVTGITNSFDQGGYIKIAMIFNNWPQLPDSGIDGKVKHEFEKIPIKEFKSIEELIIKSRDKGLEFIVVDENTELFRDLRESSKEYVYLEKIFSYDETERNNEFSIFKINHKLFDLRT